MDPGQILDGRVGSPPPAIRHDRRRPRRTDAREQDQEAGRGAVEIHDQRAETDQPPGWLAARGPEKGHRRRRRPERQDPGQGRGRGIVSNCHTYTSQGGSITPTLLDWLRPTVTLLFLFWRTPRLNP